MRANSTPTLLIERVITDDAPDDQPWPPTLGDGWVLVRALPDQRTLWRRITLLVETLQ